MFTGNVEGWEIDRILDVQERSVCNSNIVGQGEKRVQKIGKIRERHMFMVHYTPVATSDKIIGNE